MGSQAPAEVKFRLINEATRQDKNLLKISSLCEIAGVSRSGYYNWCASESKRQSREESDRKIRSLSISRICKRLQRNSYAAASHE